MKTWKKVKYVFFESNVFFDEDYFDFNYTNDTLILEVFRVEDGKATIQESISNGSQMLNATEDYYRGQQDSIFTNVWKIENDSLKFEDVYDCFKSHLLPRTSFSMDIALETEVEIKG